MKNIDLSHYPRREHFEFFRRFDEPYWGLTFSLDATRAYQRCKAEGLSFYAYYMHRTLRAANAIPEFRYRILDDQIVDVETVHGGATVMRDDRTFGFSYIRYSDDFSVFHRNVEAETQRVNRQNGLVMQNEIDVLHLSAIPWVRFTSLSHARAFGFNDSVPKISYGRLLREDAKMTMPVSVHVNHALADGYHVGLFVEHFETLMQEEA